MLEKLSGELFQPLADEESMMVLGGAARPLCYIGHCYVQGEILEDYIMD